MAFDEGLDGRGTQFIELTPQDGVVEIRRKRVIGERTDCLDSLGRRLVLGHGQGRFEPIPLIAPIRWTRAGTACVESQQCRDGDGVGISDADSYRGVVLSEI